jgi:hypothetical protein
MIVRCRKHSTPTRIAASGGVSFGDACPGNASRQHKAMEDERELAIDLLSKKASFRRFLRCGVREKKIGRLN